MKPRIGRAVFGLITIEGRVFTHDVLIQRDGQVKKRKKKLSKAIYGTSHTLSLDEAKHLYEKGVTRLIIGSGQHGMVVLADEATRYFKEKKCQVELRPTPEAIQAWNDAEGAVIGLFHITC